MQVRNLNPSEGPISALLPPGPHLRLLHDMVLPKGAIHIYNIELFEDLVSCDKISLRFSAYNKEVGFFLFVAK